LVWPISYEGTVSYGGGTGQGAMAVIDASRNMELYDEETDAEVYKLGIHTLDESPSLDPPERMMNSLYDRAKELVASGKFVTMIGGEHSVSAPSFARMPSSIQTFPFCKSTRTQICATPTTARLTRMLRSWLAASKT
jgi:arginase family enzyme